MPKLALDLAGLGWAFGVIKYIQMDSHIRQCNSNNPVTLLVEFLIDHVNVGSRPP